MLLAVVLTFFVFCSVTFFFYFFFVVFFFFYLHLRLCCSRGAQQPDEVIPEHPLHSRPPERWVGWKQCGREWHLAVAEWGSVWSNEDMCLNSPTPTAVLLPAAPLGVDEQLVGSGCVSVCILVIKHPVGFDSLDVPVLPGRRHCFASFGYCSGDMWPWQRSARSFARRFLLGPYKRWVLQRLWATSSDTHHTWHHAKNMCFMQCNCEQVSKCFFCWASDRREPHCYSTIMGHIITLVSSKQEAWQTTVPAKLDPS